MRVLVDTNVLLRSVQKGHSSCRVARQALVSLYRSEFALCLASQNIAEFWNVCTRPAGSERLGPHHRSRRPLYNSIGTLLCRSAGFMRLAGRLLESRLEAHILSNPSGKAGFVQLAGGHGHHDANRVNLVSRQAKAVDGEKHTH